MNFITENGLDIYLCIVAGVSLALAAFFTWKIFKEALKDEDNKHDS